MNNFHAEFKKKYVLANSESFLYLTVMPTEQCNFRCVYCYETFDLKKMQDGVVEGIKNLISRSAPKLKNLIVSWFGGEPLLNIKAIQEVCEHVQELKKQFDFQFTSIATTNGYLLEKSNLELLAELGVTNYQISLDGDQETHDTTRVQMNGKGSFDKIWQNLIDARDSRARFAINLRLHVTNQNTDSLVSLSKKIDKEFGGDDRFFCTIKEIKDMGEGTKGGAKKLIPQNYNDVLATLNEILGTKYNNAQELSESNPLICYASMPRHLLVRSDGSLAKCTVALKEKRNSLGTLNPDGTYSLNPELSKIWSRGMTSLDINELACPANQLPEIKAAKPENEIAVKVI